MNQPQRNVFRVLQRIIFGNSITSVSIDETLISSISAAVVAIVFGRSFRAQHLLKLQEIWRQDSMRLIHPHLSYTGSEEDNTAQRRDLLRNLVLTYMHIHEQETKAQYLFGETPFRALHLLTSIIYALLLKRANMPSFGDIFSMRDANRLRPRLLVLILRSVTQFYIFDLLLYLVTLLKSFTFAHSNTLQEKQMFKYLPTDRLKRMLKYDLKHQDDHARDDGSTDRYGEQLYHCFLTYLTDRTANICAKMDKIHIPDVQRDHVNNEDNPHDTERVDKMVQVRDSVKDAFKHCLQTLEQIGEAFADVHKGLQVIEHDAVEKIDIMIERIAQGVDLIHDEYGPVQKTSTTSDTAVVVREKLAKMLARMERHMEVDLLADLNSQAKTLYAHCDEISKKYTYGKVRELAYGLHLPHTRSETVIQDILDSSFVLFTIPLRYTSSVIADTVLRKVLLG